MERTVTSVDAGHSHIIEYDVVEIDGKKFYYGYAVATVLEDGTQIKEHTHCFNVSEKELEEHCREVITSMNKGFASGINHDHMLEIFD